MQNVASNIFKPVVRDVTVARAQGSRQVVDLKTGDVFRVDYMIEGAQYKIFDPMTAQTYIVTQIQGVMYVVPYGTIAGPNLLPPHTPMLPGGGPVLPGDAAGSLISHPSGGLVPYTQPSFPVLKPTLPMLPPAGAIVPTIPSPNFRPVLGTPVAPPQLTGRPDLPALPEPPKPPIGDLPAPKPPAVPEGVPVPTPNGKGAGGKLMGPNIPGGSLPGLSTGAGGSGASHPIVRDLYELVPMDQRSRYHGKCAEASILSELATLADVKTIAELKMLTEGATSTVFNSKGYLAPCSSCKWVLDYLGIVDINP